MQVRDLSAASQEWDRIDYEQAIVSYIAVAKPRSWLLKLFTTTREGALFCRRVPMEALDVLLKLFLGPSVRYANSFVALIGRACRLDNQRYSFLHLQLDGTLLKTSHAGAAHISTLAQSSMPGSLLKHFSARIILFIYKGVFLMVSQGRIKLLSVMKFCLSQLAEGKSCILFL